LAVREALALCEGKAWCGRCGQTLDACSDRRVNPGQTGEVRCSECLVAPRFDGFVRLGRYAPPLDRLVQRVKARAWHDVAELLGFELANVVRGRLSRPEAGWRVVPVPASPLRRLRRGIDHAGVIARALARELDAPFEPCLRARLAPRQAALDREGRTSRAPRLASRVAVGRLKGVSVLLVDDVRTTGATLDEARELLFRMGARTVFGAVVCVAD